MALFGSGSVLWGVLWGINMDLTLKLLLRCKVSSVKRGQGWALAKRDVLTLNRVRRWTEKQTDIKQRIYHTGWKRRLDMSRTLTLILILLSSSENYDGMKDLKWAPWMKSGGPAKCGLKYWRTPWPHGTFWCCKNTKTVTAYSCHAVFLC